MTRRCLSFVTLATALLLSTAVTAIAESLFDEPPRCCQVRTSDPSIVVALEQGIRASTTFRDLVDRINDSDVVVYVSIDTVNLPAGIDGRLTFLCAAGGLRYVVVRVKPMLSPPRLVALLGHELQHAREIAETTTIVDAASMASAYATRLGHRNSFAANAGTFDSTAAIRAGEAVLREVLKRE